MENKIILDKYDLVVIGGGPAGTPVAMEFAKLKKNSQILLIDAKGELGGECLFDGCIPSKILEVCSKELKDLKRLKKLGLRIENESFSWKDIVLRKEKILERRTNAAKENLFSLGNVTLLKGVASFIDENKVKVISHDKEFIISFDKCVIATGSKPFIPNFKGNGMDKIWTNDILFDKMELPKSLTIIGDGPIGIELSQILSGFGVKINLIGNKDFILPMIEKKYSNFILENIENDPNINLILNVNVDRINYDENKNEFTVLFRNNKDNLEGSVISEKVLIATGRRSNISNLNLDKAKIKYNDRGIEVNEYLQTTNKNIYASGDVVFKFPKFAHTSSYGAHIISQNLFFGKNKFKTNFDKNSWVLFSDPGFASAGISEEEAEKRNLDIVVGEYNFNENAKSQIEEKDFGFLKFIVNKKNLQIIGVEVLNKDANILGGEASLIVSKKITLVDLVNSIHPHPTISEGFVFLAKKMMGEIMEERMKNPMFKLVFFFKKLF
jgi:dihydrolipoamide dehydrogenase